MRAQHVEAQHLPRPVRQQLPDRDEIALGLCHLPALDLQEAVVHPKIRHHRRVQGTARLRDLVLVVREDEIDAAAVDIESLAQVIPRHGRTLDVPAGPPGRRDCARRGPRRLARLRRFPQHKIPRIALVRRHLYGAGHVTYVRNITDVDDKINARAAEEFPNLPLNKAIRRVTETTEKQFHDDVAALGCLPPTEEPRATEHIDAMKTLIERLVARGCAYVAEEHVMFSVPSMPEYGRLSKRSLDELIAGARVEIAPYKRDPRDFVLWKPSKPGEPAWASPCAIATSGRPGWHIECSAMAWEYLG
ncbi:MAG: hypothetical protein E6G74_09615, partial [Alphaproteobacteria bacterium]